MSAIDEVKQRTDIVELINQYTTLTKSGRNFRALCPFHSEKRPSFYVYPEQQSWHCFGACSTGGDIFSFIMKKENIDFGEALRSLAQRAGVTIPSRYEPDSGKDERERLYQINEVTTQYFHNLLLNSPAGKKARNYLDSRGFAAATVSNFQLGFSLNSWEALTEYLREKGYSENELLEVGLIVETEDGKKHDRFRNKLMFPICDARGHIIGFGARVLDDSLPKYINSPQTPVFDKSGTLYGLNLALPAIRQQNLAVIVEGYMDVITAHQNGFTNVVASMGTSITEKQINSLKRQNIVLALDADAAGEEAMLRCVDYENIIDAEIKVVILPEGKDPDDVIKEDTRTWQNLLNEALPVIDYTFNMVSAKLDLTTARDKRFSVDRLGPIVMVIKDTIRQAHYIQKLARLAGVTERALEATLRRTKPAQRTKKPEQVTIGRDLQPLLSSPVEEYCLVLLFRYPELKDRSGEILPEYFEHSENREIFTAWQQADDLTLLKDSLDTALWEHLDTLVSKEIPTNKIEQKFDSCLLRLKEEYNRRWERKREVEFALEAETRGAGADLVKLGEEGIEPSIQLGEVFAQKARRGRQQRR